MPVNPLTFSFPLGGNGWGGWGGGGANARFNPPLSYHTCTPQHTRAPFKHSYVVCAVAICTYVHACMYVFLCECDYVHSIGMCWPCIYAFPLIRAITFQTVCLHVRSLGASSCNLSSPLSHHGTSPDGRRVGSGEAMVRTGTTSQTYPWRNFSETRGERHRSAKVVCDPAGVPWLYTFIWSRRDAWPEAELKQSRGGPS